MNLSASKPFCQITAAVGVDIQIEVMGRVGASIQSEVVGGVSTCVSRNHRYGAENRKAIFMTLTFPPTLVTDQLHITVIVDGASCGEGGGCLECCER